MKNPKMLCVKAGPVMGARQRAFVDAMRRKHPNLEVVEKTIGELNADQQGYGGAAASEVWFEEFGALPPLDLVLGRKGARG